MANTRDARRFYVNRAWGTQGSGPPGLMLAVQRPHPENALILNGLSPIPILAANL